MITIKKEGDNDVSIKVDKGTQYLEMVMGCVLLVEELKKALKVDVDVILRDIKNAVEKEGGNIE